MFSLATFLFWPVYSSLYIEDYPNNFLKGKICTLTPVDIEEDFKKAHKSKLIIIAMGLCLDIYFQVPMIYV